MNVGIVCYPTFGGSGVVATELGMALANKGHKVHFITYREPFRLNALHPNIKYHEVRVKDYPLFDYPPYELVLTSKLVDVATFENLDLLHVHYAIPHASAAYMAKEILKTRGRDVPYITTLHGTDITLVGKDPSFEPVISFAINQSDAVTAVSESLKQDTLNHFGVDRDISVVPNFICTDLIEEKPASKEFRQSIAPNGEKVMIHISNFRKVKRVDDVVRIFARVREQVKSKLIFVGDGPERTSIEAMCRELGTCNDTVFLGRFKDTGAILGAADLFLLPSEFESFGLAALEAMAHGVPVISTNTGGTPEVNTEGVSGHLFDVGDTRGMAAKTVELLTDDESLKAMSNNAVQRASDFDISRILPMYEDIYASVL